MIYDNEYCLIHARRLVTYSGSDPEQLIREISGELMRFYGLGQSSVLDSVSRAVKKAKNLQPK